MSQSLQVAIWLTTILTAIGLVAAAVRAVWRILSKLQRLADGLLGEPPSPAAPGGRPGVLERLAGIDDAIRLVLESQRALDDRVSYLESQMRPNGGTTLRDAVDRIAAVTDQGDPT